MPSFPPVLGSQPKVLVLGSMPSVISLREQQYYANPQNAFWWILSDILNFCLKLDYANRVAAVKRAGVAIWDVLLDCHRPGSADSAIVKASEQANDFYPLLKANPSVRLIAFNGTAAEAIFMRHCADALVDFPSIATARLPSTSPAYAAMPKTQKLAIWQKTIEPVLRQAA